MPPFHPLPALPLESPVKRIDRPAPRPAPHSSWPALFEARPSRLPCLCTTLATAATAVVAAVVVVVIVVVVRPGCPQRRLRAVSFTPAASPVSTFSTSVSSATYATQAWNLCPRLRASRSSGPHHSRLCASITVQPHPSSPATQIQCASRPTYGAPPNHFRQLHHGALPLSHIGRGRPRPCPALTRDQSLLPVFNCQA